MSGREAAAWQVHESLPSFSLALFDFTGFCEAQRLRLAASHRSTVKNQVFFQNSASQTQRFKSCIVIQLASVLLRCAGTNLEYSGLHNHQHCHHKCKSPTEITQIR
jgi:hypothetical protein